MKTVLDWPFSSPLTLPDPYHEPGPASWAPGLRDASWQPLRLPGWATQVVLLLHVLPQVVLLLHLLPKVVPLLFNSLHAREAQLAMNSISLLSLYTVNYASNRQLTGNVIVYVTDIVHTYNNVVEYTYI